MKNKRKVLNKLKPALPFTYKDFFANIDFTHIFKNIDVTHIFKNIWNYFQIDYFGRNISENKEKNSKKKNEKEGHVGVKGRGKGKGKGKGKGTGTGRGKNDDVTFDDADDYQYKVSLLSELDAEHEAYLQHHPIGEI